MNKKTIKYLIIFGIIILIGGAGGFLAWQYLGMPKEAEVPKEAGVLEEPKTYLEVLSPNGGEEWAIGSAYLIKWKQKGLEGQKVLVSLADYEENGTPIQGSRYIDIETEFFAERTGYLWIIPLDFSEYYNFFPEGTNIDKFKYKISVMTKGGDVIDTSDNYFSIIPMPTVELKDVINYYDSSKIVYVKTIGTIMALDYSAGLILLSDDSHYLLVAILGTSGFSYSDFLTGLGLQPGDKIEVSGQPSLTSPEFVKGTFNLQQELPERIGMLESVSLKPLTKRPQTKPPTE